jgi:hypothetical protein
MAIMPPFSDFRQRVAAIEQVAGLAAVRLAELVARSEQLVIDAERSQTESALSRLGSPLPQLWPPIRRRRAGLGY